MCKINKHLHGNWCCFEKLEIENLKTRIIFSVETANSFLFQKDLNTFKDNCKRLMQNFYQDYEGQIDNLKKEIEKKTELLANSQQH